MRRENSLERKIYKMAGLLKKRRKEELREEQTAVAVQTGNSFGGGILPVSAERCLYRELRANVPVIDAAISKIRRLMGSFVVECDDKAAEKRLERFLRNVQVGAAGHGIDDFLGTYLEEMLTFGSAVGEMVISAGRLQALYNTNIDDVEFVEKSPLEVLVGTVQDGNVLPCPYQELILHSAMNPEPGSVRGVSLLRGLPFVSDILMKIYRTVGINWERVGNVRFAVSCKPESGTYAPDRAKNIASEWQKAMRGGGVSDFVSVGEVSIKAIGSDVQILDSEVPVRQMLEQIVAKMGVPPFLLGFSWSSTERMSSQQADILTSELESYRRLLNPVITKIVDMWMCLEGENTGYRILWDEITMQDEVDHANARYLEARSRLVSAQAEKLTEGGKA